MIMKEFICKRFKGTYVFEWYYIVVILAYIATLFSNMARPGVIAALLMCVIAAELVVRKRMNIHSVMDVLIVVYFFYKAASIIWILMAGVMPLSVYTGEFAVSLLPMIFYFAGQQKEGHQDSFYRKFLGALILLALVSLILYAFAPQFYCDYLYRWSYISKADAQTAHVRMQSVVGSTVFGAINVLGITSGIYFLCAKGEGSEVKAKRLFGLAAVVITFIFAVLSNQRSAMVAAFIVLIYINYLVFAKFDNIPKKFAYIEVAAIVLLFVALLIVRPDFLLKVWARLASLPSAVSERSEQWVAAVNNMYSSWFGNGLGANGHRAIAVEGAHVIADGGLIKMYCEEGVLGFSLFIYILILSFKKGIKNISLYYAEIGTIAMALISSIGSNVLAFQLVTPIFWYAVGRIWENHTDEEAFSVKSFKGRKAK